jgi:hypothetical protein
MPEYRANTVGAYGHFIDVTPMVRADDMDAIAKAKQFAGGRTLEIWREIQDNTGHAG